MIKLVCISTLPYFKNEDLYKTYVNKDSIYEGSLTPQTYDPETMLPLPENYIITCNDGHARIISKKHFITLQEWREQQINEILNEK